jgi:transcription elongation factor GreA
MKKQYISKKGLEDLKKELEQLKTVERRKILEQLAQAKAYGDLSENAEYSEMKERKRQLDSQVRRMEDMVQAAVIADDSCADDGSVSLGCTVKFKNLTIKDKEESQYQIVGVAEADPLAGKISNESPIGKAFMGKKIGDEVVVETPAGTHRYEIVKIN